MNKHALPTMLVMFALACGPGGSTSEPAVGDESAGGEETSVRHGRQSARELLGITPPERPWSEMSYEDREMDMVGRFLPIMAEIFRENDAEHYANFGCESCHGNDMRERNFAMPSTHLSPVPLPGTPAYQRMASEHPDETRFMEEVVMPAMQTMLGMGATFTCNGCHPVGS